MFQSVQDLPQIARARAIGVVEAGRSARKTALNLVVVADRDSKKVSAAKRFELVAPNFPISRIDCVSSTPSLTNLILGVATFSSMVSSLTSDLYFAKCGQCQQLPLCILGCTWTVPVGRKPNPLDRNEGNTLSPRVARDVRSLPDGADGML